MQVKAYKLIFEQKAYDPDEAWEGSLVMVYLDDDIALDFAKQNPVWPEEIGYGVTCNLKCEEFNDVETLVNSGACDVLILATAETKLEEVEFAKHLLRQMDVAGKTCRLLLCNSAPTHPSLKFADTVITTADNIIGAMFDLAWMVASNCFGQGLVGFDFADFRSLVGDSKKGVMNTFSHEEYDKAYRSMGVSAVEQWPIEAMGGRRIAGLLCSFNISNEDPFMDLFENGGFWSILKRDLSPQCSPYLISTFRAVWNLSKDMLQLVMLSDNDMPEECELALNLVPDINMPWLIRWGDLDP